jgi:hemerythrin-like domain-containing protein
MKPIGPLMREHRLIERMVKILDLKSLEMKKSGDIDVNFLNVTIDFFRMYTDKTHHGKEEDILFRELVKKPLSAKDRKMMDELIQEHIQARKMVGSLFEALKAYSSGKSSVRNEILSLTKELTGFYPLHIMKEDKEFFYPCLEYLTQQEQDDMLNEFWEFDRKLIHEKYQRVVDDANPETS